MASLVPRLLRLAWPVTLARLGIMGMGLCDVVVVGQLAPRQLAHQALGWSPTAVLLVSGIGMLTGVPVLASRAMGEGDPAAAGGAWRRGMLVSAISGAFAAAVMWLGGSQLFTFFGIEPALAIPSAAVMRVLAFSIPMHFFYITSAFFLESIQRPMASTVVMGVANVVNLALNLWLVPKYGAVGSAWATFGARLFLAAALAGWLVLGLSDASRFKLFVRSDTPAYRTFLRVGAAAALSQAAEAGAFSGMTIIAARSGGQAVASYQILLNLLAVVFMVALGVGSATTVLTAQAIGRGVVREAGRASWTGLAVNTSLMLLIGSVLFGFAQPVAAAYTADLELRLWVVRLMPLAVAIILVDGGQAVAGAALRAHGDNWFPTASHVLAYALVMPALALALAEARGLGVAGLMQAILWASVLSVGVLTTRLWVLTRRSGLPSIGSIRSSV